MKEKTFQVVVELKRGSIIVDTTEYAVEATYPALARGRAIAAAQQQLYRPDCTYRAYIKEPYADPVSH